MFSMDGPSLHWFILTNLSIGPLVHQKLNAHRRTKKTAEFVKAVLLNFFKTFILKAIEISGVPMCYV